MKSLCFCIALFSVMSSAVADVLVASTTYVDKRTEDKVAVTGNQEISGVKTYTESPMVPTPALP